MCWLGPQWWCFIILKEYFKKWDKSFLCQALLEAFTQPMLLAYYTLHLKRARNTYHIFWKWYNCYVIQLLCDTTVIGYNCYRIQLLCDLFNSLGNVTHDPHIFFTSYLGNLFFIWYTWSCQNSNKPCLCWNTAIYDCVWLTIYYLKWRTLLFFPVVSFISWDLKVALIYPWMF